MQYCINALLKKNEIMQYYIIDNDMHYSALLQMPDLDIDTVQYSRSFIETFP